MSALRYTSLAFAWPAQGKSNEVRFMSSAENQTLQRINSSHEPATESSDNDSPKGCYILAEHNSI